MRTGACSVWRKARDGGACAATVREEGGTASAVRSRAQGDRQGAVANASARTSGMVAPFAAAKSWAKAWADSASTQGEGLAAQCAASLSRSHKRKLISERPCEISIRIQQSEEERKMSATQEKQANTTPNLDQLCINTIRTLTIDAVQKAESGHAGLPLGCAPLAYVLWTRFLRHNPQNPKWANRDRFLLSAGHGSMLLYSLLYLTGYGLSLDEIKNFRQWGSKTPGHPENVLTRGVEITTGPLGQGFANGVGMGMGAAHLAARFNKPEFPMIDHYVYAIVSDGDLMEGVASEAASLAGHLRLGKLIYLYDDNHVTIEGFTSLAFSEDVPKRFEAYGWHTSTVEDGNDLDAIERAIRDAQSVADQPSLISVKTTIGYGMPTAGTRKAHSDAPGAEAVKETKRHLGWPEDTEFYVPEEALANFRRSAERGGQLEAEWNALVEKYEGEFPDLASAWRATMSGDLPEDWESHLPTFENAKPQATRQASGEVINALAPHMPMLVGGSADLGPSNNTDIKEGGSFEAGSYEGRILHFGIREHAMGSTLTGMS